MIRGDLVQGISGRKAPLTPFVLIPVQSQNPGARGGCADRGGHPRLQVGQGRHPGQRDALAAKGPVVIVKMSVGQAREHPPAAQVDHPRAGPGRRPHLVASHCQEPPVADGDRGGSGAGRILRMDLSIDQQ